MNFYNLTLMIYISNIQFLVVIIKIIYLKAFYYLFVDLLFARLPSLYKSVF